MAALALTLAAAENVVVTAAGLLLLLLGLYVADARQPERKGKCEREKELSSPLCLLSLPLSALPPPALIRTTIQRQSVWRPNLAPFSGTLGAGGGGAESRETISAARARVVMSSLKQTEDCC